MQDQYQKGKEFGIALYKSCKTNQDLLWLRDTYLLKALGQPNNSFNDGVRSALEPRSYTALATSQASRKD